MQNGVHSSIGTSGATARDCPSHCSYSSPITMIRSTVSSSASRMTSSVAGWANATLAWESLQISAASRGVARELTVTTEQPAEAMPQTISRNSRQLGAIRATLSPGASPRSCTAALATRSIRVTNSR